MRITDARTGQRTEIRPHRVGLLRATIDVGEPGRPFALGDLRALVTGDVLARTCEAQGLQVITELVVPDAPGEKTRVLLEAAGRLGVHPPARLSTRHDADASDPATADLAITSRSPVHAGPASAPLLVTGPVTTPRHARPDSGDAPSAWITVDGPDPLALRLTFLEHAVTAPIRLTDDDLADAAETLARWRALVADTAREPSGPPDAGMVQAGFDGLDEDLDARVAVRALHALEARAALPDGTRFETYVRLDQVLALELGRDIGRTPG
ncbi:hypothetical protein [Kitasatospora cathayae]|uniref:Cysteinyl-tRNA synthetase n=1 Tax=Kitasatospora cathayae TaxID=3004092 RepID=A0ABY7PWN7_9ACTN|nr:hypothetical protein [Kitasatospora sp. HUAS 3-15]WBP84840.1 hypothetical protein O1G21_02560 [Kitasatospora sp. HUAS 3-15]